MCGIAGILKFDPAASVNEEILLSMRETLWHRGPDGAGLMIEGRIGLTHRRLSIIDLAGGHQPMSNPQGSVWITYNGELYNFKELRSQLEEMGCSFTTHSDTEVVLRAYEVFGECCVDYLRGMFAFAIWNKETQQLFIARDRIGIKPLYFFVTDSELLFASEIKAILAANKRQPVFNRAILPEFLASRYVAGNETFFSGIRKLLPAHTLSWTPEKGIRERRYWQPPLARNNSNMTRSDCIEVVRNGLKDAVRSHLVSDVPVGLFLSGGIDSTALAALMAPMVNEPIRTFSVGFSETAANELEYARLAARAVKSEHYDVLVSPEQFFDTLPAMIWHEDEPIAFTSSIPLNILSRLAHEHVKVVLTGEGADELFLGYDYRYRVTYWNRRIGEAYSDLLPARLRELVANSVANLPRRMRRYAERTFLALDTGPRELFFENFSVFQSSMRQNLLNDPELLLGRDPYAESMRHYRAAGTQTLQCMSHADMHTYLVELLMKQDQMSMAASIESRVPFLDHRLVELVASLPMRHKFRGWQTKALFRDAVKDIIPKEILNRKKMGFPVPINSWLRGRFWPMVEEFVLGQRAMARQHFKPGVLRHLALEHRSGNADHGERLWLLINLEIWQRIFVDGESPEEIYTNNAQTLRDSVMRTCQPTLAPIL